MKDIDEIASYIFHLKDHHGLQVSLHPMEFDSIICSTRLHRFRLHQNPYCLYLGVHPTLHQHCVDHQRRVHAACGEEGLCGTCFAGVRELVYPIFTGDRQMGFISVSGYRDEHPDSYHKKIAREYGMDIAGIRQSYANLPPPPDKASVDVLIAPLQRMLELCYRKAKNAPKNENELCEKMVYFLQLHHTRRVTVNELCRHFYCSRSTVSHKFKAYTGMGITEYINYLRVEDAKSLLRNTNMRIGNISATVGFENSNYFTNVFREATGLSPSAYRKEKQGE